MGIREQAGDGLTWTFHLVNNASWTDGVPFTAADANFSIYLARKWGDLAPTYFKDITGIQTPDNNTVVINLATPEATLLTGLAQFTGRVVCL